MKTVNKYWLELKDEEKTLIGYNIIEPLLTLDKTVLCFVDEKEIVYISKVDLEVEIMEEVYSVKFEVIDF